MDDSEMLSGVAKTPAYIIIHKRNYLIHCHLELTGDSLCRADGRRQKLSSWGAAGLRDMWQPGAARGRLRPRARVSRGSRLLIFLGTGLSPPSSSGPAPRPALMSLSPAALFLLLFPGLQGWTHASKGEQGCGGQGSLAPRGWPGSGEGPGFHLGAPAQLKCQPGCGILTHFPPSGSGAASGRIPSARPLCWGVGGLLRREETWGLEGDGERSAESSNCNRAVLSRVRPSATPWTAAHQAPLSMDSPDKSTTASCHALLQGIFPTQGWNPSLVYLLHWRAGSLPMSHLGSSDESWSKVPFYKKLSWGSFWIIIA